MNDIRKLYFDFIDDLYPFSSMYEDIDPDMSNNDMLYNLIEIRKDLESDLDDIDIKKDYDKITTLIDLFKSLGIKPTVIF